MDNMAINQHVRWFGDCIFVRSVHSDLTVLTKGGGLDKKGGTLLFLAVRSAAAPPGETSFILGIKLRWGKEKEVVPTTQLAIGNVGVRYGYGESCCCSPSITLCICTASWKSVLGFECCCKKNAPPPTSSARPTMQPMTIPATAPELRPSSSSSGAREYVVDADLIS